ncbi:MAG: 2-amino-4-hydroxy-6-hydroxymethyldihydropteridine diphosphokinase [Tetrasphaera sp.]
MSATGDTITLTGLRGRGFHGVFDHEKRDGQDFLVDIVLEVDLRAAGASDTLADTVDYGTLAELAMARITGPAYDLIEALAEAIATDAAGLAGVRRVEVTVHKPGAPIAHDFADVAVRVARAPASAFVVALGSNLGDRVATMESAVRALAAEPGVTLTRISRLVETDPVGGPEQADYLNAVVVGSTALAPAELLAALHRIEARHGRIRAVRWGERTLDLDLIQFGTPGTPTEGRAEDPALTLPHPRAHERAFVLLPWLDADPAARLRVGANVVALARHTQSIDPTGVRPGPVWSGAVWTAGGHDGDA